MAWLRYRFRTRFEMTETAIRTRQEALLAIKDFRPAVTVNT